MNDKQACLSVLNIDTKIGNVDRRQPRLELRSKPKPK